MMNTNFIEIIKNPDKLSYEEGESFDLTGALIEAEYDNGSRYDITDIVTVTPEVITLKDKYVVIHDGFELLAWKDFMREDKYVNVVLDTHQYLMMAETQGCEQTVKTEFLNTRIPVDEKPLFLRLNIQGRRSWFEWSYDNEHYEAIGKVFDTTRFSDEYCKYGEFTGTMVGITCADRVKHTHYADFDFFEYIADETKPVE